MRRLAVRLDATASTGMAHLVRTEALLNSLGFPYELLVIGSGAALSVLPRIRGNIANPDTINQGRWEEELERRAVDLLIIDLPDPGLVDWVRLRRAYRGRIVLIDDFGGDWVADLIVNGTVLKEFHHYPRAGSLTRLLLGPKYALLRPSFSCEQWQEPPHPALTVIIGGGSEACAWAMFLAENGPFSGLPVGFVVGSSFAENEKLSALCMAQGYGFDAGLAGGALARRLVSSTLVLATGGMIVYECLALGSPIVFFPQIANLYPEAAWFHRHGLGISLGEYGGFDLAQIENTIAALAASTEMRLDMSLRQRSIVDGKGLGRVAAAVDALLINPAPVGAGE